MRLDFPLKTSVVCHDAGAANIVIACLKETGRKDWKAFMKGPAKKLWEASFPDIALYDSLDEVLIDSKMLITGTGWASNVEYDARQKAKSFGICNVAFIDHWVNYMERFIRNGVTILPDEFWVTDEYAFEMASHVFPGQCIIRVPNLYLEKQLQGIANVIAPDKPELLYVLEPIRNDWGRGVPGEFQALDYFISKISILNLPFEMEIRLRPHPSDPNDKYCNWISQHSKMNITLDTSINITEPLGRATWVMGCESYALVLALKAGKKVFCTLPPWAPKCRLPQKEIIYLHNLVNRHEIL